MPGKPTYEELEQRIKVLEADTSKAARPADQANLLTIAIGQSSIGFAVTDLDGNLQVLNNAFAEMHGYLPEELVGKNLSIFHNEKQIPSVEEANRQLKENGIFSGEIWHVRRDGTVFPTLMNNSLVKDENNKPVGMTGTIYDITEQKKIEEKLIRTQTLFKSVMDQSPIPMALAKIDGTLEVLNDACLEILGVENESEAKPGINLLQIEPTWKNYDTDGNFVPIENLPLARALQGESTKGVEYRIVRQDGTERWELVDGVPVYDKDGNIIAGFIVFPDITRLKLVEQALKESEKKYRTIFENIQSIYAEVALDSTLLEVSPSIEKILGYKRDDVIGSSISNFYAFPEKREEFIKLIQKDGKVTDYEVVLKHKNGNHVTGSLTAYLVIEDTSEPLKVISSFQDISKRKRAEEKLRQSEDQFREFAKILPGLVYEIDDKGKLNFLNNLAFELTGYTEEDIQKGMSGLDILVPEDRDRARENIKKILNGADILKNEYTVLRKDGKTFPVIEQAVPVKKHGRVIGQRGVVLDERERKRMQEELRCSEEKFSKAFYSSPVPFAITSLDGRMINVNDSFCKAIEFPREQLIGHTVLELDLWVDPIQRAKMIKAIQDNEGNIELEAKIRTKSGRIRTMIISGQLQDIDGRKCLLTTANDMTDRIAAQQEVLKLNIELEQRVEKRTAQLLEANKEIEAFAFSVSHDLRSPARYIKDFAEFIKKDLASGVNERTFENLDSIIKTSRKMTDLIDGLLKFSRAGRAKIKRKRVDMNLLVKSAVNETEHYTANRNIKWHIAELPETEGDLMLLSQVFFNLISNAVKYTEKEKTAVIETSFLPGDNNSTIYYVKDNGVGFKMKYASKLFNVFQRLHNENEFEGTGIGLALTKRIIERHDGKIWAESEPGKGATFFFELPGKV